MQRLSELATIPLVDEVTVRLVKSEEGAHWQTLMARRHSLGFPGFAGERLYQVAEWRGSGWRCWAEPQRRGDRIEHRRLWANTVLNAHLKFPYVQQVFRLERTTTHTNTREVRHEVVVGLTSRSPDQAPPQVLLDVGRQHWTIENKVPWPRDAV